MVKDELISCLTHMDMHFDLAIDFNMPTIVGIMKFMVRINGIVCCSVPKKGLFFTYFYEDMCGTRRGGGAGDPDPPPPEKSLKYRLS